PIGMASTGAVCHDGRGVEVQFLCRWFTKLHQYPMAGCGRKIWHLAIGNWQLAIGNRKYCYGNTLQRLEFRCSHVMEESRLDVGGGHIACARHWSEHDDLYLGQIRSAQTAAGSRRIRSIADGSRCFKARGQSSDFRVLSRLSRL